MNVTATSSHDSPKNPPSSAVAARGPSAGPTVPADHPLRTAFERAQEAQKVWAERSMVERMAALRMAKSRLLDRAEALAQLIREEIGKPETEGLLSEILPSADVIDYWCNHIERFVEAEEIEVDPVAYPGKTGAIFREPRGVVGLISPWNFPIALPLRTLVPALLAGNAVLFKPSEVCPRGGAALAEVFEGLLPTGVFQVLQGGADVGAALTSLPLDFVSFTGSVATGRRVAKACAENLVPCGLELGGKDAAIVLADAPLERAVHGIVWGALMNAGQSCASVERVYVEAPIYDAFLKRLVEVVGEVRMGVEMGPLATERQRETVAHHVQTAKDRGASVLAGGQKLDEGFGYAPTVVSVDHDDLPLMQEETFGPVIPVAKVRDAEEALARANASRFGLTASVWTADEERGRELAFRLRAGVVTVNNHGFTGALAAAPWCGVGETGYGITNSKHALDMLTRPRFVLVDHRRAARELWWFPYTPALRTIALSLATLRSETQGIGAKRRAAWALVGAFLTRFKTS